MCMGDDPKAGVSGSDSRGGEGVDLRSEMDRYPESSAFKFAPYEFGKSWLRCPLNGSEFNATLADKESQFMLAYPSRLTGKNYLSAPMVLTCLYEWSGCV